MIHDYRTGRTVCSFVEFFAWIWVAIAGLGLLISFASATQGRGGALAAIIALVPIVSLMLFAFMVIVVTQMARAGMDNSVASQRLVTESRKQHQELVSALRSYSTRVSQGGSTATIADRAKTHPEPTTPKPVTDGVGYGGELGVPVATSRIERKMSDPTVRHVHHKGELILDVGTSAYAMSRQFLRIEDARNFIDRQKQNSGPVTKVSATAPRLTTYRGHEIHHEGRKLRVGRVSFSTLKNAEHHIDAIVDGKQADFKREPVLSPPKGLG